VVLRFTRWLAATVLLILALFVTSLALRVAPDLHAWLVELLA
jgi:hypothetical protein